MDATQAYAILVIFLLGQQGRAAPTTDDGPPDHQGTPQRFHVPGPEGMGPQERGLDAYEMAMGTLDQFGVPKAGPFLNNDTYFEIDLRMTKEQHDYLYGVDNHKPGVREKRKAIIGEKYRWTDKTLVYEFKPGDFSAQEITDMKKAMKVYEEDTCVKFREKTGSDENYVRFQDGDGCNSDLGMVGGVQAMNLKKAGCRFMGLYWHEIGHALGLVHEHQLPDRDDYVKIHFKNIRPDFKQWFKKYKETDLVRFGVPYDITSVMHYEQKAFTLDESPSVEVLEKHKDHWIGRVYMKMLSFSDVKVVNKMYKCDERCPKVRCPPEGFVNKECQCVTPQSYYDSHCKNEYPDKECDFQARQGVCWKDNNFVQKCRKSCDYCPKFGIDVPHLKGDCVNKYTYEEKCKEWAAEGWICRGSNKNWMWRYCAKACGVCAEQYGKCLNTFESDKACDIAQEDGKCEGDTIKAEILKTQCADSCRTCGYSMVKGFCTNVWGDARCEQLAMDGDCDHHEDVNIAIRTRMNCERSCNTCGFGKGPCNNIENDQKCNEWAARGGCYSNLKWMRTNCAKACNSCDFTKRGKCNDAKGSYFCDNAADMGSCTDSNAGWYKTFCKRACYSCDWPPNGCADALPEEQCQNYKKYGDCEKNPGFTKYSCAKTCNSCEWLDTNIPCKNLYDDQLCTTFAAKGECKNKPFWMEKNCRKSCDVCNKVGDCENTGKFKELKCTAYAERGVCNDEEVRYHCRATCNTCDAPNPEDRYNPVIKCENKLGDEMCKNYMVGDRCQTDQSTQTYCRKMCGLC